MDVHADSLASLWPLILYGGAAFVLVAGLLGVSALLGPRTQGRATREIFESGIVPIGEARFRFPAKFYLIAMFFVIFDLETVFLLAYAVAARSSGWAGYWEALVFIVLLALALAYLWRAGALEWGPKAIRAR
ncbi:MAG: NADH-quinone oxidoreductase subunit A [Betaproteobacteria bacterium]|nr:NADH-quinone oxidoreductase subunit A [Betaproteobacteria bacterium]